MSPAALFPQATRKEVMTPDETTLIVFYRNGSELTRKTLYKEGNSITTVDIIPARTDE